MVDRNHNVVSPAHFFITRPKSVQAMKYSLRSLMANLSHHWVEVGTVACLCLGGALPAILVRSGLFIRPGFLLTIALVPLGWAGGLVAWAGVVGVACWWHQRRSKP